MITAANHRRTRLVIVGDYLFDPGVGLISGPSGAHYVCPHLAETLSVMVENAGGVVKHEDLTNWKRVSNHVDDQALGRNVARLKQYFRDCGLPPAYIETVPNQGYRLIAPVYGLTDKPELEPATRTRIVHKPGRFIQLVNEFRERKVCRAMLIYSAVVWLIYEFSDLVIPALGLPDWVLTLVVLLGLLGFPIALFLSWVFDLTPEGLVRDKPRKPAGSQSRSPADIAVDFALIVSAVAICTMLVVSTQAGGEVVEASTESIEQPQAESNHSPGPGDAVGDIFRESA